MLRFVLALLLVLLVLCACAYTPHVDIPPIHTHKEETGALPTPFVIQEPQPPAKPGIVELQPSKELFRPGELICIAESQQEAEEIAALYGITLYNWSGHVAVFVTEEDLGAVIARGEENGWKPLERNYVAYTY